MDQVTVSRELLRQFLDEAVVTSSMTKAYTALRSALEQETSPSDECLSQPVVRSTLPDITSPVVNDMCWTILEELPESLSGKNFNALKPALYEALKLYTAP